MKTFLHLCAVIVLVPVALALAVYDVVVNG